MIQIIGLMIGMYILTRMIDIGTRPSSNGFVKLACGITLIGTLFCIVLLLAGSGRQP